MWSSKKLHTLQTANKESMSPTGTTADRATARVGSSLHLKFEISGNEDLYVDGAVEERPPMRVRARFFRPILLATTLICVVSIPTLGDSADQAAAQKPQPSQKRKVFTNEDLPGPGSRPALSTIPQFPEVKAAPSKAEERLAADSSARKIELEPYIKEKDPQWYSERIESLHAELESNDSKVQRLRQFRATGMGMTGGLVLDQPGLRLSPENEIEQLTLRRRQLSLQIGELEDTARRNGFPPGLLRVSPTEAGSFAPSKPERRLTPTEIKELEKGRERTERLLAEEELQLEIAKKDLDLLEREQSLSRQQFYSNPNYASDRGGSARLAELAAHANSVRDEVSAAEQRIAALEGQLRAAKPVLGPPKKPALTPEQERAVWHERLQSLLAELAQVEGALARMKGEAAARGMTLLPVTLGGSSTADLLRRLEARASAIQREISTLEDDAHRVGVPPGWLR